MQPVVTRLPDQRLSEGLDEVIARRVAFLSSYQNKAYAARYAERVAAVRALEQARMGNSTALTEAVARNLFKLMAYKDEYEVARLYTEGTFQRQLESTFSGNYRLEFHLAPPIFSRIDPATGRPKKRRFGRWMMPAFRVLAALRVLRGTDLDPFGYTAERRRERRLIREYEIMLEELDKRLSSQTFAAALELARLPRAIRGFGPVKQANLETAEARRAA
jgi:indolepyruvate ferredoxin oxidoreductase